MKACIPGKDQEELSIALIVEPPEVKKIKKRQIAYPEATPEEKARISEERESLKALCEKLNGKVFHIQIILHPSGRLAAITFQKPNP